MIAAPIVYNVEESIKREIVGLLYALNEFKLSKGIIIIKDIEAIEKHGKKSIKLD